MPPLTRVPLYLIGLGLAASAHAQTSISLDGSLPNGLSGPIAPVSPGVYEISETLGEPRGDNLFHSFGNFDVGVGDRATFTAQTEYERVIARVTGGQPSHIDGTLASSVMADAAHGIGADLYLLNPWGLLFGPNASIDVPGGLHLSTAQQLRFADDSTLDLVNKQNPTLSVAEPAAFGFLGGTPPDPSLDFDIQFAAFPGSVSTLSTRPGQTLSIVGRDVAVRNRMFLTAQSGRLQVAALGESAAQVPVDVADLETRSGDAAQLGSVEVSGGAQLSTLSFDPNARQGTIVIRAGRFTLAGGLVRAGGGATGGGAAVDIETAGAVSLAANSTIASVNQGAADAGDVRISAGSLELDGANAVIRSQVAGNGAGGDVVVEADSIALRNQAQIEGRSDSLGAPSVGAVGDVSLVASDEIRIESRANVVTRTSTLGPGGDISIRAGRLSVANGSISAESGISAPGGAIQIDADQVDVRGAFAQINTLNQIATASEPPIPGGEIRIGSAENPAASAVVAEGGLISTETKGAQPGGAIHVFADALEVTGTGLAAGGAERPSALQTASSSASETGVGGSIFLELGTLRVGASEAGGVPGIVAAFVATGARGGGGSIDLDANSVRIEDGSQVFTTTQGAGHAGSIHADVVGDFVARGARNDGGLRPSGLFARGEAGSSGDAGNIDVSARSIEVLDAAEISSRADGSGNSGNIHLVATDAIRLVGGFQASSVTARGLVGRAGDVTLEAPSVELIDGGIVDVSVSGAGEGGLLHVVADELLVSGQSGTGIASSLGAETTGAGHAPGIDVDVSGLVRVERGGELNAISRGDGLAGSIDVAAGAIEFIGGRGTAASEASASAGSLRLEASDSIRIESGADLTVQSAEGQDAGTLALVAPKITIRDSTLSADADAFGGNIEIATGRLVLERSSLIALSRGEGGLAGTHALAPVAAGPAGGNISIEGGAVVLNQSSLVADGFGNANGGFIDITADPWLRSGDSVISASSEFGLEGFIVVNTPYGEVTGDLAALPETFLDASSQLEEPCLARGAPSGSFAVQQLRRVQPPPDAPLSAQPTEPQQCDAPRAP